MSGDRDMQNLMAALPDACASVEGPALAHQLERIATALEALAGTGRRPSISTRPLHSAGAVSAAGRGRRRSNRSLRLR